MVTPSCRMGLCSPVSLSVRRGTHLGLIEQLLLSSPSREAGAGLGCVEAMNEPGAFSQGGSSRLQDYLRINDSKQGSPAAAKSAETGARAKLNVSKARDPTGECRAPAGLGLPWSPSPAHEGPSWAGGRNSTEDTTHGDLDRPPERSPGTARTLLGVVMLQIWCYLGLLVMRVQINPGRDLNIDPFTFSGLTQGEVVL